MRARSLIALPLVALTLSGCGYNRIQALDEQVEQLRSNVEVELVNRNNLVPNLVATVEGAADFERGTFTEVARARAGLEEATQDVTEAVQGDADMEQLAAADAAVNREMRSFLNISVEAYPQLQATQSFMALQDQLAESENRISVARRDYNEAVSTYNTYVRQFPQAVTARVIGAERKEPFEAPEGAEQTPTVDFGGSS
ncbi:MAG: LemA family protein [Gemmatimonadota bacterium]